MLVDQLPVAEDELDQHGEVLTALADLRAGGTDGLPASGADEPFQAGQQRWLGLQERGDYCVATWGGSPGLPQGGSVVYQATEQRNRPRTQGAGVYVKGGAEFSPCLLGGADRDRLALGDVSKRDVTAPVEVFDGGGLVGVIDEPRRRRVDTTTASLPSPRPISPRTSRRSRCRSW